MLGWIGDGFSNVYDWAADLPQDIRDYLTFKEERADFWNEVKLSTDSVWTELRDLASDMNSGAMEWFNMTAGDLMRGIGGFLTNWISSMKWVIIIGLLALMGVFIALFASGTDIKGILSVLPIPRAV